MSIAEILANTLSPDQQIREDATQKLELASKENFPAYTVMLVQELANDQTPTHIRTSAGIALKNTLTAKEYHRQQEMAQNWLSLDENTRSQVKQAVLMTLGSKDLKAGTTAAQVIAAIAAVELRQGQWLDLIKILLDNMNTENSNLKMSTITAIGFVCESIEPEILAAQANQILTAVVQGARKEEPNQEIRLAALKALHNSLEFVRENFEREGERNYIMQVVCEATQSNSVDVQAQAFECLVRIMQLYYDKMRFYMEKALFGLTILGMKHEEEKVALQAIEFWSTVCDEEINIAEEIAEALEVGEQPERSSHNFARAALSEILPVLLWLLTRQDEHADEEDWNAAMASATCLSLLAQCVQDAVVGPIIPFVENHIRSNDWRYRDAAVMAFGTILVGPNEDILAPLVAQALPVLIEMMKDPVHHVKDSAAWTLGRVCEVLPNTINIEVHLHNLVSSLVLGLSEDTRIVANCSWALMSLSEEFGTDRDNDNTGPMSPYFEGIVNALLTTTEKPDNEPRSRTSAYEAVSTLTQNAAKDCYPTISKLGVTMLERLEASIGMQNQLVSGDDKKAHSELQSNQLSVLTNVIRKLGHEIISLADKIMTIVLQLLHVASKDVYEDCFLVAGALAAAIDAEFARYLEPFLPLLLQALQNAEEYQLCSIAVGLVGDVCRALGEQAAPLCDNFMQILMQDLQNPVLHKDVKPMILSCFGDIALAIGDKFEKYLDVTMMVLNQACGTRIEKTNFDLIDYQNALWDGILEAFVGITQAMKSGDKAQLLIPHVQTMFGFIHMVFSDQDRSTSVTRNLVGLVGDLGEAFQNGQCKQLFQSDWIGALFRDVRTNPHLNAQTKDVARWAREMVKRASQ
ncbi:uncharacterized protein VTP21DRAFT_9074 [Calcarisporiella thermophila]|uniref:uncharacterized protein n=1 Tax=Calcarisporiella thermophila TaxID=911321 RepID=UPI0037449E80